MPFWPRYAWAPACGASAPLRARYLMRGDFCEISRNISYTIASNQRPSAVRMGSISGENSFLRSIVFMCRVALSAMAAVGLKFLKFEFSHGIMIDYLSFSPAG